MTNKTMPKDSLLKVKFKKVAGGETAYLLFHNVLYRLK